MRRTKRRKSRNVHFQEFWDSCAQNTTSKISKKCTFKKWDSCAQNGTSEISTTTLSGILGLLRAEQDVGNLKKKCIFRNGGTPGRRTRRRKSQKMHAQEFWDSCAQNITSRISKNGLSRILGLLCAEQNVVHLKNVCS